MLSGVVRVRGIDARERADNARYVPFFPSSTGWNGARSVFAAQFVPLEVTVDDGDSVHTLKFEDRERQRMWLAFLAIPLAAFYLRRLIRRRV
jgi:hypothetical protein